MTTTTAPIREALHAAARERYDAWQAQQQVVRRFPAALDEPDATRPQAVHTAMAAFEQAQAQYEAALDREWSLYLQVPEGERLYRRIEGYRRSDGTFFHARDARRFGYEPA